jgi:hypothetical protein
MENLSELVTSYSTLDDNQKPTSNQLEEVADQIHPLPLEVSDNQTPPELPTSYQTQNPTKRISRRGLIAGGIISGLAILLYRSYNDKATTARIAETKRKTREEERKRELERQTERRKSEEQREIYARQEREKRQLEEKNDIEMHKLTDSEFTEYLGLYRKSHGERSEEENRRFSALERKIDAIKKSPSKALSLMDDLTRREYESFKRNQEEFNVYFSRIKEDCDKNAPGLFDNALRGALLIPAGITSQGVHAGLGLKPEDAPNLTVDSNTKKQREYEEKYKYMREYDEYNHEYRSNRISISDKDSVLYFYYTRHKGGMFTKRMPN